MPNPTLLKVEISSACNGKCVFCGHPGKGHLMSYDDFCKIVDMFPSVREVQPQFYGEPMLNARLPDMIEYAKSKGKRVSFYTNGSIPSEAFMYRVMTKKPDKVIFSVDAVDAETYGTIRPGCLFKHTIANITATVKGKRWYSHNSMIIVRATECEENKDSISELPSFYRNMGVDKVVVVPEQPRNRSFPVSYNPDKVCKRPLQQAIIRVNGDVVLCCVDWHSTCVVGNVWVHEDPFNTPRMEEYRKSVADNSLEMCRVCGFKQEGR